MSKNCVYHDGDWSLMADGTLECGCVCPDPPVYDATYPIPREVAQSLYGKRVTLRYAMPLADLIDADGPDGMNYYLDMMSGVTLTDITYIVGRPGPDDDMGDHHLLIEATGVLEEF